jgi:hypothetical protein
VSGSVWKCLEVSGSVWKCLEVSGSASVVTNSVHYIAVGSSSFIVKEGKGRVLSFICK